MKPFLTFILILSAALLHPLYAADLLEENLTTYSAVVATCRSAHSGTYDVQDAKL